MSIYAFDTETWPIVERGKASTLICPQMVCLSWCDGDNATVENAEDGAAWFIRRLREPDVELIGHNVAFDLAVGARAAREHFDVDLAPDIFLALDEGRIHDTMLRAQLRDIELGGIFRRGGYRLDEVAKRTTGEEVTGKKGPDVWRTRYNELADVPLRHWPDAAYDYARDDAVHTWTVFHNQDGAKSEQQETFQTAAAFALQLIAAHGARADLEYTQAIDAYYAQEADKHRRTLIEEGVIVDGTLKRAKKREAVERAWESVGERPKTTAKGNVKTDKQTLRELEDKGVEDPIFEALIGYNRMTKFRSTYLEPILDAGEAGEPLCPRYNTIVNSGRTSSSGPNIQNFPSRLPIDEADALEACDIDDQVERIKSGVVVGPDIRGCLRPRPGKVLVAADYSAIEMATLAQVIRNVCGYVTELGEAINEGKDLHLIPAAEITGRPYEECLEAKEAGEAWIKRPRQVSKVVNYSRPVGAGNETIQGQLRQQGVKMSVGEVEEVVSAWNRAWPDMQIFNRYVASLQKSYGSPYWVEQHGPNRATRGWRLRLVDEDERSAAMNSLFQGLAADGAKLAAFNLAKACYDPTQENEALYGQRVWAFVHDEFVLEVDEDRADEAGRELSSIMEESMSVFTPDIKVEADYEIMHERWQK